MSIILLSVVKKKENQIPHLHELLEQNKDRWDGNDLPTLPFLFFVNLTF